MSAVPHHGETIDRRCSINSLFFSLSPCLTGIEGAFSGSGAKTVIPRKVIGKFSIRLVPDQEPHVVEKHVRDYVEKVHKERGSPNQIK